ncbi:response regulator transcription factor [Humibacillus xanthopallidus]|uniref:LuxR family two component transcriptional regulator n=1 Tax=Humibacillus xanthopallidus TaxID=412689 RepID=A0A543I362_9MICO|nr:response regulator transcription factor [Humibacillus xanthopallidus]TQM65028.1 LuxR family two component transcriptional regulator [Humibacillus xanthopallidus]
MRAVIAEDQALLRHGLTLTLTSAGFEVAATVGDGAALIRAVDTHLPDLVVTDIRMPPSFTDEGLEAALAIRRAHPSTAILVLSQFVQTKYALELINQRRGGVGYLLKQRFADIDRFEADLHRICAGEVVLDPEVVDRLMKPGSARRRALDRLTDRQREVLGLMAAGRSNASIARELFISEKAVINHITRIYTVLELAPNTDEHRRVIAVVEYLSG